MTFPDRKPVSAIAAVMMFTATGCTSIEAARMAAPAELSTTTERVPMEGIGGWNKGDFAFAGHDITFQRSESRLSFFNIVENRSGYTNFTMRGPAISDQIEVKCDMRERNITLGDVGFTPKKMAYACDFASNGYPFPARFELQEVRDGLGGALNKKERKGEIALDRVILQVQSVHKLEGSPFEMASPIGYVFLQGGQPVGAVELNGTPVAFLPVTDDVVLRRAVVTGATALALFRDPANSSLGD